MGPLHVLLCFFVVFASACDSSGSSKCGSGSDCCAGFTCYEKNQWWAACKQSCDPNWVDPYDNLKWSCKSLGSNSPCDDSGSKQCSSSADCCGGFQCYEKNQWWAACKQSCDPNWVDPYDNLKWSCNVKGGSNNNNNNNGGCGGSKAGYDVVGPDLASKKVGSEAECCNFCRSVAGCNAASIWNNICFAKSGTSVVRKDGVTAVFKGSAPADNGGNNNNNNNGGDGTLFCPGPQDMNIDYGGVTFKNGGWEIRGDGRASSKTAFNILGGFMEWEMDLSQVQNGVNTNFYTSSPAVANTGSSTYCDIQRGSFESCMELDFVENNGKCATNVALHMFADDGRPGNTNCDRWGCNSLVKLNTPIVKFRAEIDNSGNIKVFVNGVPNNNYSPAVSSASNQVVVNTMRSRGAVIESSQWVGWVPGDNICPGGGSAAGSFLRVTNVRVKGSVVKGPVPAKC